MLRGVIGIVMPRSDDFFLIAWYDSTVAASADFRVRTITTRS